jgi:hypothetical protein
MQSSKAKDPNGASTSAGTMEAAQTEEAGEDETGGDEDLDLAWEVAETARIGMTNNLESSRVTKDALTELHQLLGDVCAERELFPEALIDYEQVMPQYHGHHTPLAFIRVFFACPCHTKCIE